jgi:hypothetical protein
MEWRGLTYRINFQLKPKIRKLNKKAIENRARLGAGSNQSITGHGSCIRSISDGAKNRLRGLTCRRKRERGWAAKTASLPFDRTIPPCTSRFFLLLRHQAALRPPVTAQEQERGVCISKRADHYRPLFLIVNIHPRAGRVPSRCRCVLSADI